jgi:hypothetical protein
LLELAAAFASRFAGAGGAFLKLPVNANAMPPMRPAGLARRRAALEETASGLALVTAAIALWNTLCLDRALNDLRCGGEMIPEALLAHLAPVGWQHINLG